MNENTNISVKSFLTRAAAAVSLDTLKTAGKMVNALTSEYGFKKGPTPRGMSNPYVGGEMKDGSIPKSKVEVLQRDLSFAGFQKKPLTEMNAGKPRRLGTTYSLGEIRVAISHSIAPAKATSVGVTVYGPKAAKALPGPKYD